MPKINTCGRYLAAKKNIGNRENERWEQRIYVIIYNVHAGQLHVKEKCQVNLDIKAISSTNI
jgi:hypothetical protein